MTNTIFYRNSEAGELLERFLISAVTSLLLVRFYLHVAGYPQIGSGGLHIAHMLWGGVLMLASSVLFMAYIGRRVQRLAAILGGVGFGIFIDEIGKFITKDNDYFFRPTIAIIYATFIVLFILFRTLSRQALFTQKENLLNALHQFEEAVLQDMDRAEKAEVLRLLRKADHKDPLTQKLKQLVTAVKPLEDEPQGKIQRSLNWIYAKYDRLSHLRYTNRLIRLFFVIEAIILLASTSLIIFNSITGAFHQYLQTPHLDFMPIIGELGSATFAAALVAVGAKRFSQSRIQAYHLFRKAILVQLLLTEFFLFYRQQFRALPTFLFNLAVLITLASIIRIEEHNKAKGQ